MFMSWLGDSKVASSRELFSRAHGALPHPEFAVEVFRSLASFHYNQQLLLQTPAPCRRTGRAECGARAKHHRRRAGPGPGQVLSERESKEILAAFNIPVNQTRLATTADEAVAHAETLGYPVVLKIDSPDVIYKSDVGGVELNITNSASVREVFANILERTRQALPNALVHGVSVQSMVRRRHARELMIGVVHDDSFGPVITFGAGGIATEIQHDRSIALPPLNSYLAEK